MKNTTNFVYKYLLVTIIIVSNFLTISLFAEGTSQWMPFGMRVGQELSLVVFNSADGNDRLGTVGCSIDERINIAVSSDFANERIYIGMNKFSGTNSFFRVMNPNGVQVYPPTIGTLQAVLSNATGNTGEGYIATLNQARNGPIEVFGAGGYNAISITPAMAGNYYIEFNGNSSTTFNKPSKHQISYFDVTVAKTNGLAEGQGNHTAVNGRLNSFQWALYNLTSGSGFNDVDATFFLYQTDDSLTLSVEWDRVKAGGWDVAFTRRGVQNTGDFFVDRQSQSYGVVGKGSVRGDFPIFVNEPDIVIYPSATDFPKLRFLEYDRCSGTTCFLYNISKGGQIEVLIDLNENGVFDPGTSDRLLVDSKPAGTHCLAWDDLDGLGDVVLAGQAQAVIKYQAGIFHMPLGDVEANPNGFNRTLIRPNFFLAANAEPGKIYYDHSVVGGGDFATTDFDYGGCLTNCNTWDPNDGNQNYVSTWFSFLELRDTLIVTFNSCDNDDDGLSDVLDIDDDNDGITDIAETYTGDHDNDGVPDYEDADYCTAFFQGVNGWDCADGLPDPSGDLDGDGLRNVLDADFPNCGSTARGACSNFDADLDGVPNYLDRDSDNDGISDLIELGGTDIDGDGVIDDLTDTDGDGLADTYDNNDTDGPNGSSPCVGQSGCLQGVSTSSLIDRNNDGITDNIIDTDGDGLPDMVDVDSDNDGIPDVIEVGGTDTDGDGYADNFIDLDKDGFNDVDDGQICTDSTAIGTSSYVSSASTGVDFGTEANGQPDTDIAELYSDGDEIVLDFGVSLPIGTRYVIHWKRKNYGNGNTTFIAVSESATSGSGYSTHSVSPSTDSETEIVTTLLEVELANTRYLKLSVITGGENDFEVDAAKYFYKEENCVAGNPLLITGADSNNDGFPDSYPSDDNDSDGILDHLDLDSDNDGIPDVIEAGGTDENGDGRIDNFVDSDRDGFNDVVDGDVGNNEFAENSSNALQLTGADNNGDGVPDSYPNDDADNDGIRNQLDLDADNDGIADVVEAGGTDVNGDGKADNFIDNDGDGFNDVVDGDPTNALATGTDTPGANTTNALTKSGADLDDDGKPDSYPNDDVDQDGVLNFLDLDADDDGILDVTEAGGTDTNRDGQEDSFTDGDGDGFNDNVDGDPTNALGVGVDSPGSNTANVTTITSADTDGDGMPNDYPVDDFDNDGILNFFDIDSDNDGITDNTEGQTTLGYISPSNLDSDGDGIDNAYDSDDSNFGGANSSFVLIDSDSGVDPNSPDYLDGDSDSDGKLDALEGHDSNRDGIPDTGSPANTGFSGGNTDIDGDGLLDGFDNNTSSTDATNSGVQGNSHPNNENGITAERDWREIADADNDGISDNDDIDDDNDGILDTDENFCNEQRYDFDTDAEGWYLINQNNNSQPGTIPSSHSTDGVTANGGCNIVSSGPANANIAGSSPTFTNYLVDTDRRGGIEYMRSPNLGGVDLSDLLNGTVSFDNYTYRVGFTGNPNWVGGARSEIHLYDQAGNTVNAQRNITAVELTNWQNGNWNTFEFNINDATFSGNLAALTNVLSDLQYISIRIENINGGNSGNCNTVEYYTLDNVIFTGNATCQALNDADGDGIPNSLDLDSDNDGIADIIEAGGVDTDGDGRVDGFIDSDNDGWADTFDPDDGGTTLSDGDLDGDGYPNRIDLDADGDGIADIIEAGGVDTNNDGRADNSGDIDNDGWNNTFDADNGGTALPTADFDGDDAPNFLDIDSDNDGITDNVEAQSTADFEAPTGADTDLDGWDDRYDSDNGGTAITINNQNSAGNPDYLDLDTDGDGQPDWIEGFDDDAAGAADDGDALNDFLARATAFEASGGSAAFYNNSLDSDSDGIPNWIEDTDLDGQPNFLDPDSPFYHDSDNDGLIDLFDTNSSGSPSLLPNKDADLEPDWRDRDNATTLPITLLNFSAEKQIKDVLLTWVTLSEINNDYFTIEKSKDGISFSEVGAVAGAGNSNDQNQYRLIDGTPFNGTSYYRLKQTDFNGDFTYSELRVVTFSQSVLVGESVLYPNPTNGDELNLKLLNMPKGNIEVFLFNESGKLILRDLLVIAEKNSTYSIELLRGKSIAPGYYTLKLITPEKTISKKVIFF